MAFRIVIGGHDIVDIVLTVGLEAGDYKRLASAGHFTYEAAQKARHNLREEIRSVDGTCYEMSEKENAAIRQSSPIENDCHCCHG